MTIPSSTVKSLCSSSETALVRASRKGQIEQLDDAQVKRLAVRARKLFDKWHGLNRGQSRTRSRQAGFGDSDANTQLKEQIFRDALDSFQIRLAKSEASKKPATKRPARKTKRARSVEHRATRAATRKDMTAAEDLLNTRTRKQPKPPAQTEQATATTSEPRAAAGSARSAKAPAKPRAAAKAAKPTKNPAKTKSVTSGEQRDVAFAAKKSRIVRSGKTTRMRGHVASRTKRGQGRRDSKN